MINLIYKKFSLDSKILDLGCGQGKDLLFLAQAGFNVLGIDKSETALKQVENKIEELNLDNVKIEQSNILDYVIEPGKFNVIICKNVLNFVSKNESLKIIKAIKSTVSQDGYILIQVFTTNDPSFNTERRFVCYFEIKELISLFTDFEICSYFEDVIHDSGHPGSESPHEHGVARVIAKK